MKTLKLKSLLASFLLAFLVVIPAYSQEEESAEALELKIGFVTFLSGAAAGPFGVPARNSAEILVETLNGGTMPAPYDTVGIAGAKIVPVFIDENSTDKVIDYRNLIERQNVDLVIGYISSGSCKAIAPVAEEVQVLTVFFDCGTPQIFEEVVTEPKYLFRTNSHATMDNVAAAKYVLARMEVGSIAGINQNYAWGQDSWRDFSEAVQVLSEDIEITTEQFPQIFAGQYGAEISALLANRSDVVHSSFWGGDMEALILQGSSRGVFDRSQVVLTTAESAMYRLADQLPDGTIIGGRGPNGVFAPESELNTWFRDVYYERYGTWPTYPSYHMALALLGVKSAYEAAASSEGVPEVEDVIAAFENLEYEAPSGPSKMALANGHQGIQGTAYGRYKYDPEGRTATVEDVEHYPAECVNPPEGVKSLDWIAANFEGAECEAEDDGMTSEETSDEESEVDKAEEASDEEGASDEAEEVDEQEEGAETSDSESAVEVEGDSEEE